MLFVGADWDSKRCVIAFEKNGRICRTSVERNPEDVRHFVRGFEGQQIEVAIEAGDELWTRLWEAAGANVLVFHPTKVAKYCESVWGSGASDDDRSAEALMHMLQSSVHRSAANSCLRGQASGLNSLLKLADISAQEETRASNRLRAHLERFHPALASIVGRSLKSLWLLNALLEAPTPSAWTALSEEQQEDLLRRSHKSTRAKFRKAFREDWQILDPEEEQAARIVISHWAKVLYQAIQAKKNVDSSLDKAQKESALDEGVRGAKGIGPFLAAAIAIGLEKNDPAERDSLGQSLGAAPVTIRSGERGRQAPLVRMRRSETKTMRKAGHLLGFSLVGQYRCAKAQYAYYRAQNKKPSGAYRRVARSFCRILMAMHRDGTEFDEDLYIRRQKKRGVPWALEL